MPKFDLTNVPEFSTFFARNRSKNPFSFGSIVSAVTGGQEQHAGKFLRQRPGGAMIIAEETAGGLLDRPANEYDSGDSEIISLYYWHGWDDQARRDAAYADIQTKIKQHGPAQGYNYPALFAELPVIGCAFSWAWRLPEMICSQEEAFYLLRYGCTWLYTDRLNPHELAQRYQWAMCNVTDPVQAVTKYEVKYV